MLHRAGMGSQEDVGLSLLSSSCQEKGSSGGALCYPAARLVTCCAGSLGAFPWGLLHAYALVPPGSRL